MLSPRNPPKLSTGLLVDSERLDVAEVVAIVLLPELTPASLVAGLGIGTIAIGFAFQDFFQNFLAGIIIMVRKKMRIGDVVECEGIIGRVEHISLRETHVRKISNELTFVPNSTLFKNPVEILTDAKQTTP